MRIAQLLLAASLLWVSAGCVTWKTYAFTDRAGPDNAPPPAATSEDVRIWVASAPPGVVVHGDTITVTPQSGYALVGRARVTAERDPNLWIAFGATACGLLTFVGAPCAFGWWIYYILFPTLEPMDGNKSEKAKERLSALLKEEARKVGATDVVFAELSGGPLPDGTVAHGALIRRIGAAPPPTEPPPPGASDAVFRF